MKHYGDITKLHGGDLPFVDVIAGGSPCQDLSVAGKRAGMLNEANGDEETTRSGLFYDQIRINKEMREAYVQARDRGAGELVRPVRYSIWENVPGAFSSNGGKDFQAVLTEFVRIVEPEAPDVPLPDKGKWPTAGCLYDEMGRWSLAWRLHDLQFWGCPQRRKRLCVLVDFDGPTAPWILFDPEFRGEAEDTPPIEAESDPRTEPRSEVQPLGEGLRGNPQSSQPPRQGVAEGTEDGSGGASYTLKIRGGIDVDSHAVAYGISAFDSNAMKSPNPHSGIYEADTSRTLDLNGGSPACNQGGVMILNPSDSQGNQVADDDGVYPTLRGCGGAGYQQGYCLDKNSEPIPLEGNGQRESHRGDGYGKPGDPSFTLNSTEHHGVASNWDGSQVSPTLTSNNAGGNQRMPDKDNFNAVIQPPVECLQVGFYQATGDMAPSLLSRDYKDPPVVSKAVDVRNGCESEDTNGSLQSKASNNLNSNNVCRTGAVVRRLTPKECERLQGFPDNWTDLGEWTDSKGKKHKDADSPRYKALGNSIGLPFWQWLAERICAQYPEGTQVRLGSLFDGIGGFPLVFERSGGKAVWASEIEEFPIAVTKTHFPEEE